MPSSALSSSPRAWLLRLSSSPTWSFLHPALLVDWLVVIALDRLTHWIDHQPVYQRDVAHYLPPLQAVPDPSIGWPHSPTERVPATTNGPLDQLTFYLPLAVIALVALALRRSLHDLHHAVLGLWASRELMRVIVEGVKNRVGRLRPDFLSRCQWDPLLQACTGDAWLIKDGRRSFPSGHSSTAWQGLFFLSLYIAGKNGAFSFFRPPSPLLPRRVPSSPLLRTLHTLLSSHLLRLSLALAPCALASWIQITRLEDHYHHVEDVLTGGLIGALCALAGYCTYYPVPWARDRAEGERGSPRRVYREQEGEGQVRLLEEDEEVVDGAGAIV
ncbi:hypothetical protein JCM10207_009304 [Rhodosporidiobolus poonsookiae]